MSPKIIDEQSFNARELEIIQAAIELIKQHGIENITIDKVVAAVPYSKGTVYKHFLGKEDLLVAISNQSLTILSSLFTRASQYQGSSRDRMMLVRFASLIYAILYPALFESSLCSKAPAIMAKASEQRQDTQQQLEGRMLTAISSIAQDAIDAGELTLPEHLSIDQVCFANWSTGYGTIMLLAQEQRPCEQSQGLSLEQELYNQGSLLFNGLQWAPIDTNNQQLAGFVDALEQVFAQELKELAKNGRKLHI